LLQQPTISPESPTTPPSATAAPDQSPAQQSSLVGYYYFIPPNSAIPKGSVVVFPDAYILAPTQLDSVFSPDAAADLKLALQAVVSDSRNLWVSNKLEIANVAFKEGHADILLQGEIYGVGDVTLIAARSQILLTIFANPAVQSATVTFNGDTIGNWGVSISINAKAKDYVFTRAEIEAYMAENAYKAP
jgi:hypothetical protein